MKMTLKVTETSTVGYNSDSWAFYFTIS